MVISDYAHGFQQGYIAGRKEIDPRLKNMKNEINKWKLADDYNTRRITVQQAYDNVMKSFLSLFPELKGEFENKE